MNTTKRIKRGSKILWAKAKKGYKKLASSSFVKNQRSISKGGASGFDIDLGMSSEDSFSTDLGRISKKKKDNYGWSNI